MRKITYLLGILVAMQIVAATPVMLATNITYPDILVASAVSSKIGAEVFWVGKDIIPEEIFMAINETNPEEIYIIGGPAVVSTNLEDELSQYYNVTRIWGMTRYGTSAEVAKYFWPEGSEKAVIVSNSINQEDIDLIVKARDLASQEGIPLLLTPPGKLSSEIEETLKDLGVKEVYLVGDFASKVKESLENMEIKIEEFKDEESIEKRVMSNTTKVLIVATKNWRGILYSPGVHRGVVIFVNKEAQIPSVIQKLEERASNRNLKIKVTGIPELAKKICDELNKTDLDYKCVTGKKEWVIRKIAKEEKEEIKRIRKLYEERIKKIREKLKEKKTEIAKKCEINYERAKSIYEDLNASSQVDTVDTARYQLIEALYNDCKESLDENKILHSIKILNQLKHETKLFIWENRNEIDEDLKLEMEKETEENEAIRKRIDIIRNKINRIKKDLGSVSPECKRELELVKKFVEEGKTNEAYKHSLIALKKCEAYKQIKIKKISKERKVCPEVITPAVNPKTGECKKFPTPCKVPKGWRIVRSCKIVEKVETKISKRADECRKIAVEMKKAKAEGEKEEFNKLLKEFREKCRVRIVPKPIKPKPVEVSVEINK